MDKSFLVLFLEKGLLAYLGESAASAPAVLAAWLAIAALR
jgi:hypothetical protein